MIDVEIGKIDSDIVSGLKDATVYEQPLPGEEDLDPADLPPPVYDAVTKSKAKINIGNIDHWRTGTKMTAKNKFIFRRIQQIHGWDDYERVPTFDEVRNVLEH